MGLHPGLKPRKSWIVLPLRPRTFSPLGEAPKDDFWMPPRPLPASPGYRSARIKSWIIGFDTCLNSQGTNHG